MYPRLFNDVLGKLGIYSEELLKEVLRMYSSATPKITLFQGVREILSDLRKKRYLLGIISNGNVKTQKNKVKLLKISNLFDKIIYARTFGKKYEKPSIVPYKAILEYLNALPKEAMYIGDNPYNDFIGAKKCGMVTVRMLKGEFKDIFLSDKYETDYTITNLKEIYRYI